MTTESANRQWPEDHGHESGDIGNFVLGVRNDEDIELTDADLDYSPISVDASGAVKVTVINETLPVTGRALDCSTDSVQACLDEPIEVFGVGGGDVEVHINGDVNVSAKHPGVPGTIVDGSRWHVTGFQSLGGTLTIVSPTPGVGQRIVCDWLDYSLVAISLSLGAGSSRPQIHDGLGGPIIWQVAFGLLGTIGVGASYSDNEQLVLVGSANNPLQYQLPATLNIFDKALNFGGYIVQI